MSIRIKSPGYIALPYMLIFSFYCGTLSAQTIVKEQTETVEISDEQPLEQAADETPDRMLIKRQKLIDKNLRKGFSLASKDANNRAIAKYEKVLELDPANSNAYYNIALIYAKSDQQPKAIEIIDKAFTLIDGQDNNEDTSDLYGLKASCLSDLEKYQEALPLYEKSLSIDSNNANAHYNLGYTYLQLEKWDLAISYFDQYIKIVDDGSEDDDYDDSEYAAALSYTGQAYFELEQYQKAIEHFDLAIQKKAEYHFYLRKAQALRKINRSQEALDAINTALAASPKTAAIYHQRYQLYRDENRLAEAYKDLEKAYSLEPEDADYIFDMGAMYQKNNQMEQAIKQYEKCIALNKNIGRAYGNIANIYSKSELTRSKAYAFYKKAIAQAPKEAGHYYNLANAYREANETELAIAMYNKAIELDPALSMALNNMAIIYADKKEFNKAITLMQRAIKLNANDYTYNAQIASLYFETKQYKNTVEFSTKAMQIRREGSFTLQLLNQRAVSRQMLGEYKNAIYDYLDIIGSFTAKEKKENAGIISNAAYCYMESNELDSALQYFKQAVEYEVQVDHLIGLFSVQYLLGNQKEFGETLARAKQVEPKLALGYKGIELLEADGYFYTKTHKKILKEIFKQNP